MMNFDILKNHNMMMKWFGIAGDAYRAGYKGVEVEYPPGSFAEAAHDAGRRAHHRVLRERSERKAEAHRLIKEGAA